MIVDTSALMAILRNEAEAAVMIQSLSTADRASISGGTWIELGAIISGAEPSMAQELKVLMTTFDIIVEPVSVEQARIGHDAYRAFGKGNHPARLNLGDCFSYALARETGEPLLFKGNDFNQTDLILAAQSVYPR